MIVHTEELGVLKAMGFSKTPVLVLVMLESCLIAILGGLAIAWLVTPGGSQVPTTLLFFVIRTNNLILGSLLAVALGLLAGTIPPFQAMQQKISEAFWRGSSPSGGDILSPRIHFSRTDTITDPAIARSSHQFTTAGAAGLTSPPPCGHTMWLTVFHSASVPTAPT